MVLIESKNFGLPVIAFDCKTGPAEIISNDGYLVDYSNDCEFLIKLEKLMFNHELRKELSENMKYIDLKHGYENIINVLHSKYKEFKKIITDPRVVVSVDCFKIGLVLQNHKLSPQHYCL